MFGIARSSRDRALRATLALAAATVVTLVTGCGALGSTDSKASAGTGLEKTALKVSILPTTDLGPFWLAQDSGYFKDEGLDVTSVVAASGQASLTKAISGEADIAFSTYPPFFIAKSTGAADMELVADATSVNAKSNAIVTVPNSPVKTIYDLAGSKIAITAKNTAADLLTRSVMQDHGVDFSKVKWVLLPLPNVAAALQQGEADAAYLPEPYITQAAKTAGAIPVIDINTGATQDFPLTGFGATKKWVRENPKTLAAFQRAMQKATHEATNDRAKVEPLLVRFAKIDEDTAKLLTLPGYGSSLDSRRLQRVPDLLLQLGAIPSPIDVNTMLGPQPGK
ncbi:MULTISPECIES: ABC transporter substrate-binding protein [unclassified Amycolatopsis]|uniref:ABC transporter substrate-binding protein n=1 Tax=unclassified Amycolatopsis TaxID=2618356 RepID=UPI002E1466CD|nr:MULTISPECIES: ABC transporter substrate-binding protein [unclassified Amycolatopsis]WSJ73319.1 ABC transporter substrate-binding protein [Amycolatopsis sp. NBC_01307]WSK83026.1 ABC transporter substrate-binding protein [Amycolatopsis sp. NBC_01286]